MRAEEPFLFVGVCHW